tara:strand:- start:1363 stop:1509 length:147 start_codon:yes stop_codon:yes gene_type:complete
LAWFIKLNLKTLVLSFATLPKTAKALFLIRYNGNILEINMEYYSNAIT